jgi:hypothetical protein
MAEVFSAPEEVKQPELDFGNYSEYEKNCEKYIEKLKEHLKKMGYKGKNFGEIIRFPVADGTADYMVISMRPLKLVHLPLGDAWDFQYAHLLTAKEVNEEIAQQKALEKLFSKR